MTGNSRSGTAWICIWKNSISGGPIVARELNIDKAVYLVETGREPTAISGAIRHGSNCLPGRTRPTSRQSKAICGIFATAGPDGTSGLNIRDRLQKGRYRIIIFAISPSALFTTPSECSSTATARTSTAPMITNGLLMRICDRRPEVPERRKRDTAGVPLLQGFLRSL